MVNPSKERDVIATQKMVANCTLLDQVAFWASMNIESFFTYLPLNENIELYFDKLLSGNSLVSGLNRKKIRNSWKLQHKKICLRLVENFMSKQMESLWVLP